MNEIIWKDIPEFNGIYQISNTGEIRSIDGCPFCESEEFEEIEDSKDGLSKLLHHGIG